MPCSSTFYQHSQLFRRYLQLLSIGLIWFRRLAHSLLQYPRVEKLGILGLDERSRSLDKQSALKVLNSSGYNGPASF